MKYEMAIFSDYGLIAKHKDLTFDQVIQEIKKYEGKESILIDINGEIQ